MKETKKALVMDVTKEINELSEHKRNRIIDIMRGMLLMDEIQKASTKADKEAG